MGLSASRIWTHPSARGLRLHVDGRGGEHPELDQERDHVAEVAIGDVQRRQQRADPQGGQGDQPEDHRRQQQQAGPGHDPVIDHHRQQQAEGDQRNRPPPRRPPRTGSPAGGNRSW